MPSPALISLTFDDGFRCQFEKALPILDRHRLPATFFLIANQEPTHESWQGHLNDWWKIDWRKDDIAMLKRLLKDGHEIGAHSVTHHRAKMEKYPEFEANESKRLIENWLDTKVSSFCYPFYDTHSYFAAPVTNAHYLQARGGRRGPNRESPRGAYYSVPHDPAFDRFNVDTREITNEENVAAWARPGAWFVLTYHGIGTGEDGWSHIAVDEFARQMAELAVLRDSGAAEVVTFKGGANRFRSAPPKL
jgi:peptidoglycan/xylan/chitin deacetylase (PgdA/CDA1 family)